jgi:hypothetical protein
MKCYDYSETNNKSETNTLDKVRDIGHDKNFLSRSRAHSLLPPVEVVMNTWNSPQRRLKKENKMRVFGGVDHLETERN